MYGDSQNHQKLVRGMSTQSYIMIERDILSVATTKYPFIIGAKRKRFRLVYIRSGDSVLTFIV
jgi:hypothetical protein